MAKKLSEGPSRVRGWIRVANNWRIIKQNLYVSKKKLWAQATHTQHFFGGHQAVTKQSDCGRTRACSCSFPRPDVPMLEPRCQRWMMTEPGSDTLSSDGRVQDSARNNKWNPTNVDCASMIISLWKIGPVSLSLHVMVICVCVRWMNLCMSAITRRPWCLRL